MCECVCVCVRVRVRACVRACVHSILKQARACVCMMCNLNLLHMVYILRLKIYTSHIPGS